ncbi:collagen alpha-1(IX) chain-like [Pseudopipra pipra]|uniref:collagen alpha-1(IX) chain-like n=1 Tax=Pseudopipra pipra TaxID=415032 RepID=UPI003139872C
MGEKITRPHSSRRDRGWWRWWHSVSPTTDNNYSRSRARRRKGKGGEAKSCCSIFSKIMKPTPLALRTRAILPASAGVPAAPPGQTGGAARAAPAARAGDPGRRGRPLAAAAVGLPRGPVARGSSCRAPRPPAVPTFLPVGRGEYGFCPLRASARREQKGEKGGTQSRSARERSRSRQEEAGAAPGRPLLQLVEPGAIALPCSPSP